MSKVVEINGVKVLAAKLDASNIKAMRELMDDIRSKMPSGVVHRGPRGRGQGEHDPVCFQGPARTLHRTRADQGSCRAHCRFRRRTPDQAQAGGTNPAGIDEAMDV